ncbi:MAG: oxalate decarboxylase/phosphoglucose isomerase-like protein (cupin superfamily) [Saprospiraceae bacterium]|jgi:oxalate decarboxylase/phosphoglucose isomerase-like protein (cupin superfamily)
MQYWKFTKEAALSKIPVNGRGHYWHYNPEITKEAGTVCVKVVVEKGAGHNFHRHPKMHEILYFIKGTAEQWVEDEKQILGPGDSVYIEENAVHATFNAGDEDLEFLATLGPAEGWEAGTIDEYENLPYANYRSE